MTDNQADNFGKGFDDRTPDDGALDLSAFQVIGDLPEGVTVDPNGTIRQDGVPFEDLAEEIQIPSLSEVVRAGFAARAAQVSGFLGRFRKQPADAAVASENMPADETLETEIVAPKESKLKPRIEKTRHVLKEIVGGMGDYAVGTAKGLKAIAKSAVSLLPQRAARDEDGNIIESAPRETLGERIKAARQNIKEHSEAIISGSTAIIIGAGVKMAATAFVATSSSILIPAAAAVGITTTVTMFVRAQRKWREEQIELNKENFYQEQKNSGLLELQSETEEGRRAEFFNSVHKHQYDERSGYNLARKVGAFLGDVFRKDVWSKVTARDVGYAMGAGLTAGVSSALTHFAHDYFTSPSSTDAPAPAAPAAGNAQPAAAPAAPVIAPPVVDFASAPMEQKINMLTQSLNGRGDAYITERLTSAAAGNAQAMKDVGHSLWNGENGFTVDHVRARALIEQAAQQDNPQAKEFLRYINSLPDEQVAAAPAAPAAPVTADAGPRAVHVSEPPVAPRRPRLALDLGSSDARVATLPQGGANSDLLPVEAPAERPTLTRRLVAVWSNWTGLGGGANTVAESTCTSLLSNVNACDANYTFQAGDMVGVNSGQAQLNVAAVEGQTMQTFMAGDMQPEVYASTSGALTAMNEAASQGPEQLANAIPTGHQVQLADGTIVQGRGPALVRPTTATAAQFADAATGASANDNGALPAAVNDNAANVDRMAVFRSLEAR